MDEHILDSVIKLFSKKRNIILIPHSSPDADALGSCLALYHFFKSKNEVKIISPKTAIQARISTSQAAAALP